jgi:membrane associated rhomboid family serine protease
MILPLGDENTTGGPSPLINWIFIAINVIVFIFLQGLGSNEEFTYSFSTVPEEIVTGSDIVTKDRTVVNPDTRERYVIPGLGETPEPVYITLITSMFMHGDFMHIIGNMLFLFIFGDNLERRMGHLRYFGFYMITGIIASLTHVFTTYAFDGDPMIPSLGASGAISGVLGGYILLFPKNRVRVLLFNFFTQVPAWVALGIWFAYQLLFGFASIGVEGGGVAYGAHIGGFIAGLVLVKFFVIGRPDNFIGTSSGSRLFGDKRRGLFG